MQAKAISNAQPQSISDDLETWAAAEKNNHSITADSKSLILYVNTDLHRNSIETNRNKIQAAEILAKKILSEATQFARTKDDFMNTIIAQQLPSLEKFVKTGKLGNLKNEWEKLIETKDPDIAKNKALERRRKNFINEASDYLPKGLILSEKTGAVSSMTHMLDPKLLENLKDEIIKSCEDNPKKDIGGQPVDVLFEKDCYRMFIEYEFKSTDNDGAEKEESAKTIKMKFETAEKNIELINRILNGDKKSIETISKIINQRLIRRAYEEIEKDIYRDKKSLQALFKISRVAYPTSNKITIRKNTDDDLILDVLHMEKYESIAIPPDYTKAWNINRGPLWDGAVSQTNFGSRLTFSVRLNKQDLQNGVINPNFDTPPTKSICVKME